MQFVEANGARIPAIGLGTWELRGRACARLVEQALRLGYRQIDTAQIYENEREVGEGLRASKVRRDEIFVTTKVWTTHFAPNDLERSTKESLTKLRLSEVDLLLLHWPNPQVPLEETLGALAHVRRLGMTRHIGVSNFTVALIEEAVAACPEPLVCDQVEYHPYLDQTKVLDACARQGMAVVAYSPVAKGRIKNDQVLARIGRTYGKTAAQVCLRWLVQQNVSAIPRTSRIERLSENIDVFDFVLSDDEMRQLSQMASAKGRLTDFGFAPKWDRGLCIDRYAGGSPHRDADLRRDRYQRAGSRANEESLRMALKLVIGNKNYSSWSMRPWLALRANHIAFEEIFIPLYTGDTDKKRILAFTQSGKVPTLLDDNVTIWDSLAIIEYVAERFPQARLWPEDRAARGHARSVSAEMHSGFAALRNECGMNLHRPVGAVTLSANARADIARIQQIWIECRQRHGKSGPFLFGAFGGADAMFAPVVHRFRTYAIEVAPEARQYMDAMMSLPAFQEWTRAGLAETLVIEKFETA